MIKSAAKISGVPNNARRAAVAWWILTVILAAGAVSPYLLTGDAQQWAIGLSFLFIVFGITFLIMAIIYTRRARICERMLRSEDILAHWTFTPEQWRTYAERENIRNKREKRNIFLAVLIITVMVCGLLAVTLSDTWYIFAATGTGIIVMMGLATWLAVWTRSRQNRAVTGEVFISLSGAYVNRELHVWHNSGAALEDVIYSEENDETLLVVSYSVPNRYNRQSVVVRVPVPVGEEEPALQVLKKLRAQIKK